MKKIKTEYIVLLVASLAICIFLTNKVLCEYKTSEILKSKHIEKRKTLKNSNEIDFNSHRKKLDAIESQALLGENLSKVASDLNSIITRSGCEKTNIRIANNDSSANMKEKDEDEKMFRKEKNRVILKITGSDHDIDRLLKVLVGESAKYSLISFNRRHANDGNIVEINLRADSFVPLNIDLLQRRNLITRVKSSYHRDSQSSSTISKNRDVIAEDDNIKGDIEVVDIEENVESEREHNIDEKVPNTTADKNNSEADTSVNKGEAVNVSSNNEDKGAKMDNKIIPDDNTDKQKDNSDTESTDEFVEEYEEYIYEDGEFIDKYEEFNDGSEKEYEKYFPLYEMEFHQFDYKKLISDGDDMEILSLIDFINCNLEFDFIYANFNPELDTETIVNLNTLRD